MSIDWSKAPEGTTHYHIAEDINPWRKIEGTVAYEHYSGKWLRVNSFNEGCMPDYYVPIPQETWDGQGLPPVGIQIEAKFPVTDVTGTHYHWRRVIVAVAGIPRAERECLVYDAENTKPAWVDEFRPLRTPEQVAAAERWAAIQQMLAFADVKYGAGELMSPKEYVETAVAALYDAGYRRQEEGK
ncbi:hypothetical protein [Pseudomonas aeruginosa]|uniref:hypothetical protein n=1 Tax=Pseudomonas aeruginosa TaxID=287 RepID=UPI00053EC27C|nr:hypothetical protein [Pseudomonas aeruginosa]MDJ1511513.1 hypothetical protein [Pseudomonas aeruginosa]UVN14190.1 hypothetical protein FBPa47_0065 [Pseudomonas phage vB_PeaS_FBPa47]HCF0038567.1 hypothetical protein [Pseudomonas aeruginosa]